METLTSIALPILAVAGIVYLLKQVFHAIHFIFNLKVAYAEIRFNKLLDEVEDEMRPLFDLWWTGTGRTRIAEQIGSEDIRELRKISTDFDIPMDIDDKIEGRSKIKAFNKSNKIEDYIFTIASHKSLVSKVKGRRVSKALQGMLDEHNDMVIYTQQYLAELGINPDEIESSLLVSPD